MSPDQKALVQETWRQVTPIADTAASLFYGRLFVIDPSTRPMFAGVDLEKQRQKLLQALTVVVASLDRIEELVPTIQDLGRRHVAYGVKDKDYDTVGAALLSTLEAGLGAAFTDDVKEAWATVYGILADTMKTAAAKAA